MAFGLTNLIVRSRRRLRAVFSDPVGSDAFNTAFFTVTSLDSLGASPVVNAALLVVDSAQVVELSLATELADGAAYQLDVAAGVPSLAGGVAGAASYKFRTPYAAPPPSPELATDESLDAIYGNDLLFVNDDFVETAEGDLAVSGGVQNVQSALTDRCLSDGLPWDPSYGANPREYVDGPDTELPILQARMIGQVLSDDRVKSATGSSSVDDETASSSATILIDVVLVGQTNPITVEAPVPNA